MIIYGFHTVQSRLKLAPESIEALYIDAGRDDARARDLLKLAQSLNIKPSLVDTSRLDKLCPHRRHQGVVAFAGFAAPHVDLDDLLDKHEGPVTLLLLDGVTDPRNLGACLRVADGAGALAVIAPKDHACALTEVAIQTASGAAESVPYIMVTNLARTMDELKDRNIWLVGTADEAADTLYTLDLPSSIAWVLGAEGKGLRRLTRDRCDQLVRIPMAGQVSSLNVSVAAGVVLYESVRRRSMVN
jgi:23S rRNA (guanosine2251-2'-O)-methyltransferase